MTLTFDEAVEEVDELSVLKEGQIFEDNTWWNGNSQVVNLLEELRETYAPIVKMTKEQKRILDSYREPGLYEGDHAFYTFYNETHEYRLSLIDTGLFDNITEKQLMQAWLYPETIKIVD